MRIRHLLIMLAILLTAFSVFAQAEELQDLLDQYVDPDDPGVVIFVSDGDGETVVRTQGLANLEARIPVATNDHFRIASTTKTFVAVVTLQLAEEGALALDDPITQTLPTVLSDGIPYSDQITVRQLLNMTSGIFNYTESEAFNDAIIDNPGYRWTPAETISFVEGEEPYFAPGDGWYYSNSNYNLLQLIIESVTGQSLADVLQSRIFTPLAMEDSFLEDPAQLGQGIIRGYGVDDNDQLVDVTDMNDGIGLGDGGIVSTAADLEAFARALFEGDLLSESALDAMSDFIPDGEGGYYGLGLGLDETEYGDIVGHDGAASGFQSFLGYHLDSGIVVVALTNNFDTEILEDLLLDVWNLVLVG